MVHKHEVGIILAVIGGIVAVGLPALADDEEEGDYAPHKPEAPAFVHGALSNPS